MELRENKMELANKEADIIDKLAFDMDRDKRFKDFKIEELENKLRERDDSIDAVRSKLVATEVERDGLIARLSDASGAVKEAKAEAAKCNVKMQHLSDELRAAHAKSTEKMAGEIEQLRASLKATKDEMELRVQEAKNCAEGEVRELVSKYETASAKKDPLVEELRLARDKLADLQACMGILDEALATSQQCNTSLQANKIVSDRKLTEVSNQFQYLKDFIKSAKSTITILEAKLRTKDEHCKHFESIGEQLIKKKDVLYKMELRVQKAKNCAEGGLRELVSKYETADNALLQARMGILDEALATSQQCNTSLQANKIVSDRKLTEVSNQFQYLKDFIKSAKSTITILEAKLRAKDEYCKHIESIEQHLKEDKLVLNKISANLHNLNIQIGGNIRVMMRFRPLIKGERMLTLEVQPHEKNNWSMGGSGRSSRPSSRGSMGPTGGRPSSHESGEDADDESCPFHFPSITDRNTRQSSSGTGSVGAKSSANHTSFNDLTKQVIEVTEPHKDRGGLKERRTRWKFGFDRVFSQDHGQYDVWEAAEPLVQSCVDGFHVCMFAYGQVFTFRPLCLLALCIKTSFFSPHTLDWIGEDAHYVRGCWGSWSHPKSCR